MYQRAPPAMISNARLEQGNQDTFAALPVFLKG